MKVIHRIRLRGPWEIETLDDSRVRYTRRFGKPRTLDANESVWLNCECLLEGNIIVNKTLVGAGPICTDISALIQLRNVLVIEGPSSVITEGIVLEIRTTD